MAIDVHAHYFPPAYCDLYDRLTDDRPAFPRHPAGLQARIAALDEAGVEVQVLGLGHNQPCFADEAASIECARVGNDLYAEAIAPFDGRFKAFGAVPLPHVEPAIAEARRCLDELGFAGLGLGTSVAGRTLDEPDFEPFWAELDARAAVVFLHPVGTSDTFITGLSGFMMGPKLGGPTEAAVATLRLVLSGVTTRHPRIRFVVAPMGGTLPYLWRRFEEMSEAHLATGRLRFAVAGDPLDALRRLWYDTTLSDDPRQFQMAADLLGVERLVFGSDAPRVPPAPIADYVRRVPGLEPATVEAVLGGTASAELGL